jgi:hypothetical protein
MQTHRTRIALRRLNNALRIFLPVDFVARHELSQGDYAVITEEADGMKLKFIRMVEAEERQREEALAVAG